MTYRHNPRFASLPVATGSVEPTPDDVTEDPDGPFVSLEVFAAGTVKFTCVDGTDDTRTIPAGWVATGSCVIPVAVTRVWATGTSVAASDIRGLK